MLGLATQGQDGNFELGHVWLDACHDRPIERFVRTAAFGRLATTALASHPCPPTRGGLAMNAIATCSREPWNKGKLVGQKAPLRLRDIWAIRVRLQIAERTRDLALFDLALDSKLRAGDLTKLRVRDVAHGEHVSARAMVMQQKTQRPVQPR